MKKEILECDICDLEHGGKVKNVSTYVLFDHDQEDGRNKVKPYFEYKDIDLCEKCLEYMIENRRIIYAYGAMGYNKYYLKFLSK